MRKRKVSFKRHKTEHSNRDVALWDGRPTPFTIGSPSHIEDEYPSERKVKITTNFLPEVSVTKERDISPKQWFKMVKKNESGFYNRKKKKRNKKAKPL